MKRRDAARKAVRNAQAIDWVKTHTLRDLRDLVNEMSDLGEDVMDISQLLTDLTEIDRSMHADTEVAPEICEYAEIAG
jgi:hypothetical protein